MELSAAEVRRQVWAERLRRYSQSGLTVAAFCDQERVSLPSFYQWRRKLAGSPEGGVATAQRDKNLPVPLRTAPHLDWARSGVLLRILISYRSIVRTHRSLCWLQSQHAIFTYHSQLRVDGCSDRVRAGLFESVADFLAEPCVDRIVSVRSIAVGLPGHRVDVFIECGIPGEF